VHYCLERAYDGGRSLNLAAIQVVLRDYHALWRKEMVRPTSQQEVDQELTYGLVAATLPRYFIVRGDDFIPQKKVTRGQLVRPVEWLKLEQQFNVPFLLPDGRTIRLRGKFDGSFRCHRQKLWLFETKTKSRIDEEGLQDCLPLDIQVMLYLLAQQIIYGEQPEGVLYNVIRRPGQRRRVKEPLVEFFRRVADDVNDPKRTDHYFLRWEMAITRHEIEDWVGRTLVPMLTEVCDWFEGKAPHYMNEEALITKYGRSPLYDAVLKGDFSRCFRRVVAFNELSDFKD